MNLFILGLRFTKPACASHSLSPTWSSCTMHKARQNLLWRRPWVFHDGLTNETSTWRIMLKTLSTKLALRMGHFITSMKRARRRVLSHRFY
jgi:hypothetical protein